MSKPLARRAQVLEALLVNRRPTPCAVCDEYIGHQAGLPVVLDAKSGIIEFVHLRCVEPKDNQ
jgi:hypothetical protein